MRRLVTNLILLSFLSFSTVGTCCSMLDFCEHKQADKAEATQAAAAQAAHDCCAGQGKTSEAPPSKGDHSKSRHAGHDKPCQCHSFISIPSIMVSVLTEPLSDPASEPLDDPRMGFTQRLERPPRLS